MMIWMIWISGIHRMITIIIAMILTCNGTNKVTNLNRNPNYLEIHGTTSNPFFKIDPIQSHL